MHTALSCVWPNEAAALQTLGQQAQTITIPPQQLDQVATSATEDKDVPTKGIGRKMALNNRRQTIKATACKTACKTFQISGVISVQKLPPWVV